MTPDTTLPGLLPHDRATLLDAAAQAVDQARRLGVDAASATAHVRSGYRFVASGGVMQARLRDGSQTLGITLFHDGRAGSASTTAFDPEAIAHAVGAALAIARRVQPDADALLPDPAWLAHDRPEPPLWSPSGARPEALVAEVQSADAMLAAAAASAAVDVRPGEFGSTTHEAITALVTSDGFARSEASTMNNRWATALASDAGGTTREMATTADRRAVALEPADTLAARAVGRAIAMLGARPMAVGAMPVLFDARAAETLVWSLVEALGGEAQVRRISFLQDALGTRVTARHVDLVEDPDEPWGLSSGAYDREGVGGGRRFVIEQGEVRGYFLGTRSARRLAMRSTGNAGGPWNLRLTSREDGGDAAAMLARLGNGLLVTHLLGGSTDPVTGTWTQAVAGVRVAGGELVHPVRDVTLSGRLGAMLDGIIAVGSDEVRQGAVRTGSILVDSMIVGGRS